MEASAFSVYPGSSTTVTSEKIETNQLGSKVGEQLLHELKPFYWFCELLHTKFSALVPHAGHHHPTRFLALDKFLPRYNYLQVIFFPALII